MFKLSSRFPGANDINRCSATKSDGIRCKRVKANKSDLHFSYAKSAILLPQAADKNLCILHQGITATKVGRGNGRFTPLYGNNNNNFHIGEQELRVSDVQNTPFWIRLKSVHWHGIGYTVVMIDADATKGQYLHWIIANLQHPTDNMITKEVITYEAPSITATGSGLHRYIFYLFGQMQAFSSSEIQAIQSKYNSSRDSFDIDDFVAKNNLKYLSCNYFTLKH
jgi:hypothetical protein